MIVDIFTHIFPQRFFEAMEKAAPHLGGIFASMRQMPPLYDLDARLRTMDELGDDLGDYCQILSLPNPPLDNITPPELGAEMTRLGNETMAELVDGHGDRFPVFVAALPMRDVDAALAEIDYAIGELGARGVQIYTDVCGKPLDDPEFEPIFAAMAAHDLPIWLHPSRTAEVSDYATEKNGRLEMWWVFGWPYETSVAMARLALCGLFDRYPELKIITHHLGGMVPYFEGRVDGGLALLGSKTEDEDLSHILPSLKRPHIEYFKMFYGDTALFGPLSGTKCGLNFFGVEHTVFATDAPFASIAEIAGVIEQLGLSEAEKQKVFCGNAERLLKMKLA